VLLSHNQCSYLVPRKVKRNIFIEGCDLTNQDTCAVHNC